MKPWKKAVKKENPPELALNYDPAESMMYWSMHHRQDRHMVMRAVEMAVWQRQGAVSVVLHSDRGCQFTSGDYQKLLKQHGLVSRMSAVGHCGDEGFFGMLKRERTHHRRYPNNQ